MVSCRLLRGRADVHRIRNSQLCGAPDASGAAPWPSTHAIMRSSVGCPPLLAILIACSFVLGEGWTFGASQLPGGFAIGDELYYTGPM